MTSATYYEKHIDKAYDFAERVCNNVLEWIVQKDAPIDLDSLMRERNAHLCVSIIQRSNAYYYSNAKKYKMDLMSVELSNLNNASDLTSVINISEEILRKRESFDKMLQRVYNTMLKKQMYNTMMEERIMKKNIEYTNQHIDCKIGNNAVDIINNIYGMLKNNHYNTKCTKCATSCNNCPIITNHNEQQSGIIQYIINLQETIEKRNRTILWLSDKHVKKIYL